MYFFFFFSKALVPKPNHAPTQNQFGKRGVYQLTCPDCNMSYIGQIGLFRVRFQEHFRDFKYGNNKSKFAMHLLQNKHSIGHIQDIMKVLYITNKSINREMGKKYKTMDEKLKKLIQSQSYKPSTSTQFYPRVVNKTNIHFSDDELGLLNKGLKYNLSKKREHWISNLALEA